MKFVVLLKQYELLYDALKCTNSHQKRKNTQQLQPTLHDALTHTHNTSIRIFFLIFLLYKFKFYTNFFFYHRHEKFKHQQKKKEKKKENVANVLSLILFQTHTQTHTFSCTYKHAQACQHSFPYTYRETHCETPNYNIIDGRV